MQRAPDRTDSFLRRTGASVPPRKPSRRLLARFAALHTLSAQEHAALCSACAPPARIEPATDIVVEGERVRHGYVVEEGWACRYRLLSDGRRQILSFIVPGDCIGGANGGGANGRPAVADHSIAALTRCRALSFAPESMADVQRRYPAVRSAFERALLNDLAVMRERIVDLGRRTARERLAHLLLELRHRLGMVGLSDGRTFALPLTQETIADALGLSVVHVNRVLRGMAENRIVRYRPGSIELLDVAALAALAEFRADA